ncbi:MAG TPA: hypothetical protein VF235_06680 [Actinomycetota bacterium]
MRMKGFGGVLGVVLAQTVAGGLAFTWLFPLWHETKRSYFTIYGSLLTVLFALPAWLVTRAGASPGDPSGEWIVRLTLATLVLVAGWTALMLARWQTAARVVGFVSVPVSAATLVAFATAAEASLPVALAQVAVGAIFLGAVYDGLFLGHWYLTDRKLTRAPIERATRWTIGASIVEMVAIAATGFGGADRTSDSLNPILAAGDVAPWIALGMAGATLLIAGMTKGALRGTRPSAVQSATGFYYLAVVTAFTAEIAVKTRYFPG